MVLSIKHTLMDWSYGAVSIELHRKRARPEECITSDTYQDETRVAASASGSVSVTTLNMFVY